MFSRSLLLDLYAAFHKSGQIVDRAVDGTGISPEDYAFVSIIGDRVVTPTELAREFGLSLSTVLFRATRNVELGFVERVTNPHDGRSFLLRLTPRGRRARERAGANLRRAVTRLEARLDRPAAEIQEALLELQRAFDLELAESEVQSRR
ncbi:MAG TPA: MarR family transcriptional regulator [Gaiellaceae bacterium]|nr:MarR family transcriptional regulator [Gaiellaceae bacterium]